MGTKFYPHQDARLPAWQIDALRALRQSDHGALEAKCKFAERVLGIVALVDIGGDLAPPIEHLYRIIAALDLRQINERAALIIHGDPGFAIDDVEVRVGPI